MSDDNSNSFNYDNFLSDKKKLEYELDKFKLISESFDATNDPNFFSVENIDLSSFTNFETYPLDNESDCEAQCLTDDSCLAFSFFNNSCNKYNSYNSIESDLNVGSDSVLIKKGKYLTYKNGIITSIADNLKKQLTNFENQKTNSSYYYDKNNIYKNDLDRNHNALQDTQKKYRNLIVSNKSNIDPIVVNTYYLRYMFLFTMMFVMLVTFVYYTFNHSANSGSNFMLYLVLFIIVFSVSIIYILK